MKLKKPEYLKTETEKTDYLRTGTEKPKSLKTVTEKAAESLKTWMKKTLKTGKGSKIENLIFESKNSASGFESRQIHDMLWKAM